MSTPIVAIIPARFDSTRLPGKPLAAIGGKPMIEHVYARASAVACIDRVVVATDDERIVAAVRAFGGDVVLTRADHPSGTDRIAEVAAGLNYDIIVNVQGDLPFLDPEMVERPVAAMLADPSLPMATVREPLTNPDELSNPNVVKVVADSAGNALYFSRSPLPYWRDGARGSILGYRHIGLYVYRREFLLRLAQLPPSPLEQAEKLEQLRVLENGYRIHVADASGGLGIEVDTPADLARANAHVAGTTRSG